MISWWKADSVLQIDECDKQIKQMITAGEVNHPLQAWCNIVFIMLVVSSQPGDFDNDSGVHIQLPLHVRRS